ncbi:MAG: tail fiber domain-containing protein, partial [Rhodospirillales bacterium]|nr:tail fiber domain-containing protein [Rhodospirillales bacterium]
TLTVPEHNAPFASLQGTGSGFGCVEGQAAYGGVIAKCDAFGAGKHFIVTPGGCTNSTTPTCAGGNDTVTKAWSNVAGNNVSSLAGSTTDGPQNTVNLMQLHNAGGSAPAFYHAAAYCANMNYGGYTDWYLPASDEMVNFFYPNRVAVGGYVSASYWTSNPGSVLPLPNARFLGVTGATAEMGKVTSYLIRCARREGVAEPGPQADTTPDATVIFPTAFAASAGARTSSAVVTVTGITPGTAVSVSGPGNPTIKINGGAEVASGTVQWNDTVQVVMDSPAANGRSEASVTIGTATLPFSVITRGNCGGSCAGVDKRVFVTSTTYTGNLGGLAGADAKCQARADAASLGGTWKAILTGSNSAADWAAHRMDYNWDRLVNMNGQVVATSPADLWDGTISNSIKYDANAVAQTGLVWSASGAAGDPWDGNYNFCQNWTAATGSRATAVGQATSSDSQWIAFDNTTANGQCSTGHRLYCQEVTAPGVILAITPAIQNSMDVTGPGAPATGSAVTFTVQNTGTGASAPLAMSMDNVTNFEILNDTCTGNILAPAATCTLDVRPRAYANGTYNGVLSAASSGAATATAALDGTASSFLYTAGQWYLGVDPGDIYYSDGPVGIGTNDPDVSLDIAGTDALIIPRGTTAQRPGTPVNGMIRYNTTVEAFEVYENGAWVAMGAAVSDVRLKTDIKPLDRMEIVDKLMQIDTYSFRLKADQTGRENMGVIAQEIEKIFPDLVDGEGDEIRSVHYVELIAPLIETAQYLKGENDAMKEDVSELKDQVALLNKAAVGSTGKASMDGWAMLLLGLLFGGNAVLLVRFGRRDKRQ